MKKIIFILGILFILVSCRVKIYEVPIEYNKILRFEDFEDFVDFRTIATDGYRNEILCDANTGVLYVHDSHSGFLSPIYNADGSLKNIKDYAKVEE